MERKTNKPQRPNYSKSNRTLQKLPPAPDGLNDVAVSYWYELGGMLVKQKALMQIDIPLLRFCCEFYASAILEPDIEQKKKYVNAYSSIITKFGATPKARLKSEERGRKLDEDDGDEDDDLDEWEDF